jgi:hypothetical protein
VIDLDWLGVLRGLEGPRGGFRLCRVGCHLRGGEMDALELERPDHHHGQITALLLAEVGLLEACPHGDDSLRFGDLEL